MLRVMPTKTAVDAGAGHIEHLIKYYALVGRRASPDYRWRLFGYADERATMSSPERTLCGRD